MSYLGARDRETLYAASPHRRSKVYHRVAEVRVTESGGRIVDYLCGRSSAIASVFTRAVDARTAFPGTSSRPCKRCLERA